jgi:hypothetical protein
LFPALFFGKIKAIFFQINILAFGVTGNDFNGIESQTLAITWTDNSVIVTLDEQGRLVFPEGKVFAPDESVRLNIVGYPEKLEKVGAQNLANYTDEIISPILPVTRAPLKYSRV